MRDHIITHNGQEYDLTKLEKPLGLLPEPVQQTLENWPHGISILSVVDGCWDYKRHAGFNPGRCYRARPAPKVTEHVLFWEAECPMSTRPYSGDTHKITIRYFGDDLPPGTYSGPDGAEIVVERI